MTVAFHGTGIKSAISLISAGIQERETLQHTNLAAGGFCIAQELDAASSYAKDRLDTRPGSLAAVLAVEPLSGNINVQEECESGGLEPLQVAGHDSEFIVSATRYDDFSVKWHSLLCRVPSGVAEFRVNNARMSDYSDKDGRIVPTLELSVTEQNVEDRGRPSATGVNIDIRTGQAVRWD